MAKFHTIRQFFYIFIWITTKILAQESGIDSQNNSPVSPIMLEGPRVGFTFITGETADVIKKQYKANPFITQFGWQFEQRFMAQNNGFSGITEIVPLIGGIEQGIFIPSLSFLVGIRTAKGVEFGVGPNISFIEITTQREETFLWMKSTYEETELVSNTAIVFAGGVTKRYGNLNIPVNLSLALSKGGTRLSLLTGFNMIEKQEERKKKVKVIQTKYNWLIGIAVTALIIYVFTGPASDELSSW